MNRDASSVLLDLLLPEGCHTTVPSQTGARDEPGEEGFGDGIIEPDPPDRTRGDASDHNDPMPDHTRTDAGRSTTLRARRLPHLLLLVLLTTPFGCRTTPSGPPAPVPPETLPVFLGDGTPADWSELVARARAAEIVVIGEEHDDVNAHELQRALYEAVLETEGTTAISLEMFERDEQDDVDAWLAGDIDTERLVADTESVNWGGAGAWYRYYQPVIDLARDAGAPVVAANAPRRYVRRARTEGYEPLRALPADERAWFDLPDELDRGPYFQRFAEIMRELRKEDELDDDAVNAVFRSQQVWDATMAASVVDAIDRPDTDRVVHLIGRFHSDLEGGTIVEIRKRRPGSDILVVSCVRTSGSVRELDPEDLGRGDVVVYTPGSPGTD
jgi:uncharacterized iron-regulated protein